MLRQEDYARVEELYRGLKLNCAESGEFKRLGGFHFGEMEMHRRASPWHWFPFCWPNLYRGLSCYGERPLRALSWLMALIPGLAFLVRGLGVDK